MERLRQPEYTGENRCPPCTALNVAIALVVSSITWTVVFPIAGVICAASLLLVIYLRGYVVPGTPEVTARYLPNWAFRILGKEAPELMSGEGDVAGTAVANDTVDVETHLLELGIIESCDDDVCLEDDFAEAWRDEIQSVRDADLVRLLERTLGYEPGVLTVKDEWDDFVVRDAGEPVGIWESEAALAADLTANHELLTRVENWAEMNIATRGQLLSGLRLFLEHCPICDGPMELARDEIPKCCHEPVEIIRYGCPRCKATLVEFSE